MNKAAQKKYLTAASSLLGLPILPAHEDEVLAAFAVISAQAQLLKDFVLDGDVEAAPRFTP